MNRDLRTPSSGKGSELGCGPEAGGLLAREAVGGGDFGYPVSSEVEGTAVGWSSGGRVRTWGKGV